MSCPVCKNFGFSPPGDSPVRSCVARLFDPSGPAAAWSCAALLAIIAVTAIVIAVVINPVDAVLGRWPPAHVFNKGSDGLLPSLAYSNTSPSIAVVIFRFWFMAPKDHVMPDIVFRMVPLTVFFGVSIPLCRHFFGSTAATLRSAACQTSGEDRAFFSTVANAIPIIVLLALSCIAGDKESPKSHSRQTCLLSTDKMIFNHDLPSQEKGMLWPGSVECFRHSADSTIIPERVGVRYARA